MTGRGRKPVIQTKYDLATVLVVSPTSHSSNGSGQTGEGTSVSGCTSQTSPCGDADCTSLDTGASEEPRKHLHHEAAPAQLALEPAAHPAEQPCEAPMAAICPTGQSEPCMAMAPNQDAGHLSTALRSGQLQPPPPDGTDPFAAAERRTGGQDSKPEMHAGATASKEMHVIRDKHSDGRTDEGRRKLALQGRLAALQRIKAQRSFRSSSRRSGEHVSCHVIQRRHDPSEAELLLA